MRVAAGAVVGEEGGEGAVTQLQGEIPERLLDLMHGLALAQGWSRSSGCGTNISSSSCLRTFSDSAMLMAAPLAVIAVYPPQSYPRENHLPTAPNAASGCQQSDWAEAGGRLRPNCATISYPGRGCLQ